MRQCKYGELKSPIMYQGKKRFCKLAPKTKRGKLQDRKKESAEIHERKYRDNRDRKKVLKDIRKLASANE